ncbi:MAG: cysteine desulfurase-like protein [Acidimicrobiia bacterium]|nr:MAG: cysteine desulfurase-like protein [Acidimicrobiia bacterium]
MPLDVDAIRAQFPALLRTVGDRPAAYLDGPGGTQVPDRAIAAIGGFLRAGGSNLGAPFVTSRETATVTESARVSIGALFNASPDEIVFGQNMTTLTFAMSRALAATWEQGDNIVLTRLDHDANVWPWVRAAQETGVELRWLDFDPDAGCRLHGETLSGLLDERTRLVAVTHASNAVGTIVDIGSVVEDAHRANALTYVDAVHYSPHRLVDVAAIGTDFLVASAYKFFGPHTGCLYGRRQVLDELDAYKIRPAPDKAPDKWETGTQSFESLAGVTAAVDYIASLGEQTESSLRSRLVSAMAAIGDYEETLSARFLDGIDGMGRVTLYGENNAEGRTPTFALSVEGVPPAEVSRRLGEQGIFVWSGDYYAVEVMRRLGKADQGLVRIGFVHYNTAGEVDRVLEALAGL